MKKGIFLALIIALTACSNGSDSNSENEQSNQKESNGKDALYDNVDHIFAIIETNKGKIVCDLAYQHAPITVANFIALSEGMIGTRYTKPGRKYYDQLTFHRVIPNFMIQGGDPLGNGTGGPGYTIPDEFTSLKHDRPGTLSMANSGPNTGGSQFFITHVETPWLDGEHSVFGYVIEGQDVVDRIEQGDEIITIMVFPEGESAEKFDVEKYNIRIGG